MGYMRGNGKEHGNYYLGFRVIVPLKQLEYGVYDGYLNMFVGNPYFIYLRGAMEEDANSRGACAHAAEAFFRPGTGFLFWVGS